MDIVIVKGAFNDKYRNNATYIAFSIQDTVLTLRKFIESFVQLVSSEANHPDHLPLFCIDKFLLSPSKKVEGFHASKFHFLTVPEEEYMITELCQ